MKYLFRVILLLGLIILLDIYTYQAIQVVTAANWAKAAYWIFHGLYYGMVITVSVLAMRRSQNSSRIFSLLFSTFVVLYLPKLFVMLFLLGEDITRLFRWVFAYFDPANQGVDISIPRIQWVSVAGLFSAIIPLIYSILGITRTKYDYAVRKVKIGVKNLPDAFSGFTISQISDIHTGSLDNLKAVAKGIEKVNAQGADVIFFTGDLVNNLSAELAPEYQAVFSKLTAPEGVYSVLGNHDYGDYVRWESKSAKKTNLDTLIDTHKRMGWDILLNEHRILERNGEKLAILGVENWSAWSNFPAHGRLDQAYAGTEKVPVKVLLSHDPTHWDAEIRPKYPDIDLTLSGHTHGMQFGIEVAGFKWSPVQYMFKQWAGLYTEGRQHLYVNRGFGFLGFSGRIGIKPEITVLELVRA